MKSHFTARDLAGLPVAGWPTTERAIQIKAEREGWTWRKRAGRGGGREYDIRALPLEAQRALILREGAPALPAPVEPAPLAALPAPATGRALVPAAADATQLADWQRDCMAARIGLVREVQRLAAVLGTERAVRQVVEMAAAGTLPAGLAGAQQRARAKQHGGAALSRATLYEWLRAFASAGELALAPRAPLRAAAVPAWAPALLAAWQRPQKPPLTEALAVLRLPAGVEPPSYDQARRFLSRLHAVEREAGRLGARELKKIRPFVRRGTEDLWPCEVWTMDGHSLKAEVSHPLHGRPFVPEITSVLDVATRLAVGWSVALAESSLAVLDALRYGIERHGIPAILYVDNGSAYHAQLLRAEGVGMLERLGITVEHSIAYNSQARGIIERSHQTLWIALARDLPTYKRSDRETRQLAHKLTRAAVKAGGRADILPSWPHFCRLAEERIALYNTAQHRALPKVRDAAGRLRHRTPAEAWQAAIAEGWDPASVSVPPTLLPELFRPYAIRRAARGEVSLFGNVYFSAALEGYHGELVRVGYDIHDAGRVWVRDRNGVLICTAEWNANKRSYFPVTVIERAAETRATAREKRLEAHLEEVRLERDGARPAIEAKPLTAEEEAIAAAQLARLQAQVAEREAAAQRDAERGAERLAALTGNVTPIAPIEAPAAPMRPVCHDEFELWRWVHEHPEHATAEDRALVEEALRTGPTLRLRVELELAQEARKKKPAERW